jgi:predicted transcriptional regulator of viral defense system
MRHEARNLALNLVDDLVAEGETHFTFNDALRRLDRSPSTTANLLRRMVNTGLLDRVRRGHYVVRPLGVLGTRAAAEDVAIAVAAAFSGHPHRMAYHTALDEHDLIVHPVRTIYVATTRRMRVKDLSGRPLRTVLEPETAIQVGAIARGPSQMSDLERALLDAAARPDLAGGAAVLADAITSAGRNVDPERLTRFAEQLGWAAALRRLGSISDALAVEGLAGRLAPLHPPVADLDLEPGGQAACVWRDARWRVRWGRSRDELRNVARE